MADPTVREFTDSGQPVRLLLPSILHHITDDEDPAGIAAALRDALPPGSYLAISSFRMPGPDHPEDAAKAAEMEKLFNEQLGTGRWRDHDEILAWFGDWELVQPGLVPLPEWRPDVRGNIKRNLTYDGFVGGVARTGDRSPGCLALVSPECASRALMYFAGLLRAVSEMVMERAGFTTLS